MDLPDRTEVDTIYELTSEQVEVYNAIIDNDIITLDGKEIDVTLPIVKISKLLQVLSGFIFFQLKRDDILCNTCNNLLECIELDIMPWDVLCKNYSKDNIRLKPKKDCYIFDSNPKIDTLTEDLEINKDKVIIWCYYVKDKENIAALLNKKKIKYITADVDASDILFEDNEDIRVYLGQISQGIGITLNSATTTIYYSHSLNLEHRLQSIDRNYRLGQKCKTLVKNFCGKQSIEESVLTLLSHKIDVKDFIQNKVNCKNCDNHDWCKERDILIYTEKCKLYEVRGVIEDRVKLKLKKIRGR
jgi:SNF2 family DNA or RNA helicase